MHPGLFWYFVFNEILLLSMLCISKHGVIFTIPVTYHEYYLTVFNVEYIWYDNLIENKISKWTLMYINLNNFRLIFLPTNSIINKTSIHPNVYLYLCRYPDKIPPKESLWMPLGANLLKLESSILTRAKRATNRNNVATEKRS